MSNNHYFRCIKSVLLKEDENTTNVVAIKNEIWKAVEDDDTGLMMTCVEGPNEGWDINFTNQQFAESFEWEKGYIEQ